MSDKGIDYDLEACLENNPQSFEVGDIDKVVAVIEGENDERDWHWVLRLSGNRYVYLRGGCDYTGWDCQSWASSIFLGPDMPLHKAVDQLGYGDSLEFTAELQRQLKEGKQETWREQKDKEFGITDGPIFIP